MKTNQEDPTESSNFVQFEPIAIIHHTGDTTHAVGSDMGDTYGHYRADILDRESKEWIRTSDDEPAKKIGQNSVTKQGYIFLFKNTHTRAKTNTTINTYARTH